MNKRFFIFLFLSSLVAANGGNALAELTVISAEGSARRQNDEAATKLGALNDALKNAVFSAVGSLLSGKSLGEHSEEIDGLVKQKGADYVLHYRVHKEGWITHHDVYGLSLPGQEIAPGEGSRPEDSSPSYRPLEELLEVGRPLTGTEFFHIWVDVKVDVGRLRENIRLLTAVGDEETSQVTVLILDVQDHATYESIKDKISRVDIVRDVSYNSFFTGRIVLTAEVQGTAHLLGERLDDVLGNDFVLIPYGPDKLIIRAPGEVEEQ